MTHNLVLGNRFTYINPPLPIGVAQDLEEEFSTVKEEDETAIWRGFDRKSSTIYTGLVPFMRRFCQKRGVGLSIVDGRERPTDVQPFETNYTLREYQEEAVARLVSVGRGAASVATGGGKTVLALELPARLGVSAVIVVPTQVIWVQFIKTALKMYAENIDDVPDLDGASFRKLTNLLDTIPMKQPVGYIGQGEWKPRRITIAIAAALNGSSKRITEYLDSIDMLYSDEHHHAAADNWFDNLMRSNAYHRYGGSGTVYRTDGQDMRLFATTGPVIHSITATWLIENGWLAKPIIKMIRCSAPRIGSPKNWARYYRANVLYNMDRTRKTLSLIGNSIQNNIRTLVLVAWDEHAQSLLSRMSYASRRHVDYVKSNHGRTRIKEAIRRFANGDVRVLIATPLLSEGYDLCSIDRLIRASAMKSPIRVTQETGRVLRIDGAPKKGVKTEVWDFFDVDHNSLSYHSRERYKTWASEEAFDVSIVDDWAQTSFEDRLQYGGYLDVEGEIDYIGEEPSDRVTDLRR